MKKKYFISLIVLIFIVGFSALIAAKTTEYKNITLFVTSDTHGQILTKTGGLLRLATLLKKEIKESGGLKDCLIIDCGDTLHGSLQASLSKGRIIEEILNYLDYNVFVPGNHDLEFGIDTLLENIKELKADTLAANLKLKNKKNHSFLSWKLYHRNGLKIAVIGLTFPFIDHWIWYDQSSNYILIPAREVLKKLMPEILRSSPDLIILATHTGLHGSYKFGYKEGIKSIAANFPAIDIILGGHTHQLYAGTGLQNNTYYIQAGSHSDYLGKMQIKYDLQKHVASITSQLLPLKSEKPDPVLLQKLAPLLKAIKRKSTEKIACIPKNKKIIFGNLAAEVMGQVTKADAAIYGLGYTDISLTGPITYKTIYDQLKYEDRIIVLHLTGKELKKVIREILTYKKKHKKYKKLYLWNIDVNKNTEAVTLKTKPEKDGKITLAVTSYYAAGARNKSTTLRELAKNKAAKTTNTEILLRKAIIKYLKTKYPVVIKKQE